MKKFTAEFKDTFDFGRDGEALHASSILLEGLANGAYFFNSIA